MKVNSCKTHRGISESPFCIGTTALIKGWQGGRKKKLYLDCRKIGEDIVRGVQITKEAV